MAFGENNGVRPAPAGADREDGPGRAEERFRLAAELSGHFVFEWNADTQRLEWFEDVDRLLGFEPGGFPRDLAGYVSRIHADDRERIWEAIRRNSRILSPFDEEYRLQKKDGTYIHVLSRARPVMNEQGAVERWVVVHADVTERRRAQEALRESERKYRLMIENVADVIWATDLDLKITYVSPSTERVLGYSVEEAMAMALDKLLTSEGLTWVVRSYRQSLAHVAIEKNGGPDVPDPEKFELQMAHKNGSLVWTEINWAFQRDGDGRIIGYEGVIRDVTSRKQAEEAIRLAQERLRAQYNAIPVPTYTWKKDDDDFTLVDYNAAAVAITRGRIRDYAGIKASELYKEDPAIRADLDRCYSEHSSFERAMLYNYQSLPQQKYLVVKYAFVAPDQVLAHTEDQTERWRALQALAEIEQGQREKLSAEVQRRRSREYSEPEDAGADLKRFPSPAMRQALEEAEVAARSNGNVLLLGRSGVGKTYLAGWIHQHSERADGPFFDINCTTLAASLVESELFGYEPGAFTGSQGRKRGLLELAHGGTLFLDEIGELALGLQAKLLSFLDTREFMRVGGEEWIKVDARIIVATNRDLAALVREKRFREDLYYRLNVLAIMVPPLKDRKEDMPLLAAAILKKIARDMGYKKAPVLGPEALEELKYHDWPGNVRELKNVLERVMLRNGGRETISGISELRKQRKAAALAPAPPAEEMPLAMGAGWNFDQAVDQYMRRLIEKALAASRSKTQAAQMLGISRHALHRYLKKFGIGD